MPDDTPVLDTIADMTAASIARCGLDDDQLILVRLAALAAVDARPVSYLAHIEPVGRGRGHARAGARRPGGRRSHRRDGSGRWRPQSTSLRLWAWPSPWLKRDRSRRLTATCTN